MPINTFSDVVASNVPAGTEDAGLGAQRIRETRAYVKQSFPNFTAGNDIVTLTAPQINDAGQKSAAQTVSGAWNFTGGLSIGGVAVTGVRSFESFYLKGASVGHLLVSAGIWVDLVSAGANEFTSQFANRNSHWTWTPATGTIAISTTGYYRVKYNFDIKNVTGSQVVGARVWTSAAGYPTEIALRQHLVDSSNAVQFAGEEILNITGATNVHIQHKNFSSGDAYIVDRGFVSIEKL